MPACFLHHVILVFDSGRRTAGWIAATDPSHAIAQALNWSPDVVSAYLVP